MSDEEAHPLTKLHNHPDPAIRARIENLRNQGLNNLQIARMIPLMESETQEAKEREVRRKFGFPER